LISLIDIKRHVKDLNETSLKNCSGSTGCMQAIPVSSLLRVNPRLCKNGISQGIQEPTVRVFS